MRVLTIEELIRMTKIELLELTRKIAMRIPKLPVGSQEGTNAFENLQMLQQAHSCRPT
jgi:hypothetical protein